MLRSKRDGPKPCGWLSTMRGYARGPSCIQEIIIPPLAPKVPQVVVLRPAFTSVGHEHGERDMIKQVAGCATENQLPHAALCVSSLD